MTMQTSRIGSFVSSSTMTPSTRHTFGSGDGVGVAGGRVCAAATGLAITADTGASGGGGSAVTMDASGSGDGVKEGSGPALAPGWLVPGPEPSGAVASPGDSPRRIQANESANARTMPDTTATEIARSRGVIAWKLFMGPATG